MANTITKKDVLTAIKTVVENGFADVTVGEDKVVTADDVIAYVDTTIAQLDKKNEKAREKSAERKAEGDALRATIEGILTEDEYKTIANIVAEIDDEEVTPARVTARLSQLCKANKVHKTKVKVGDRTVNGYALGAAPEEE